MLVALAVYGNLEHNGSIVGLDRTPPPHSHFKKGGSDKPLPPPPLRRPLISLPPFSNLDLPGTYLQSTLIHRSAH
jgi:hypothetical protein